MSWFSKLFNFRQESSVKSSLSTDSLKKLLGESDDLKIRSINVGGHKHLPTTIIYIEGLVNIPGIDENILKPLQISRITEGIKNNNELIKKILDGCIPHTSVELRDTIDDCKEDILNGSVAFIFDNCQKAITFEIDGFEKRPVTASTSENIIKGGRDTFVEFLRSNTSLIRGRIRSDKLRIKEIKAGKKSNTKIAIVYMDGLINPGIVKKITKQLELLDTNSVLTLSIIEDHIIDNKFSVFPQLLYIERPDKCCSNIMEGKLGIIVDGIPGAYILPATFSMFMQAPEDYSFNYYFSSFVRLLRYSAFFITLILPALYISIISFHQEMLPWDLAISIIKSKEGVPFSTSFEVLFLLFSFELLIEAGLRIPNYIGQAISIVGAIVIGEAASAAKLISPTVIVVVALAGISGFIMPVNDFSNALRICRIVLVFFASITGFLGISLGMILLLYLLAKMEYFDTPYLYPYVASEGELLENDSIFRLPGRMKKR